MPRVAVIGNTGSGKTTFARRLAAELGVPHIELDAIFWRPGWAMTPADEFAARVDDATCGDAWVIDGNYFGKIGARVLERADLVVWLDPPLRTILPRLFRRTLARIAGREELWGSNRETLRNAFLRRDALLWWAIQQNRRWRSPERAAAITRFPHVRLRSPREANEWLARYLGDGGQSRPSTSPSVNA